MRLNWISMAGIMLLLQSPVGDVLTIHSEGEKVAEISLSEYGLPALPLVDPEKLEQFSAELDRRIFRKPVNAVIGDRGDIVPEQNGFKLDVGKFVERFEASYYGGGPLSIEAPRKVVYPRVDSELLSFVRDKPIGSYVTYFNSGNRNRSRNIALAVKAINNTVVFQGESFSFNEIVGIRTTDRGYVRAPVIVKGELSEGIGGGICQVSSTLFNATDRAGLKIVKRYSHSRSVPYVPSGRDATVSWGGPDFVFQNQYDQPILIRAFAGPGSLYVTIYSSDAIEYKPREVPGISKRLPEETSAETGGSFAP